MSDLDQFGRLYDKPQNVIANALELLDGGDYQTVAGVVIEALEECGWRIVAVGAESQHTVWGSDA